MTGLPLSWQTHGVEAIADGSGVVRGDLMVYGQVIGDSDLLRECVLHEAESADRVGSSLDWS